MKIIKDPKQQDRWWTGKTAICEECGLQVQLEATDPEPKSIGEKRFVFCPHCLGRRAYLDEIPQ